MPDMRPWIATFTDDPIIAIAERIGATQGNLNRQVNGTTNIPSETVVKIARAYDANPLPGLVEIGLIEPGDIRRSEQSISEREVLLQVSDEALVVEIRRRLGLSARSPEGRG